MSRILNSIIVTIFILTFISVEAQNNQNTTKQNATSSSAGGGKQLNSSEATELVTRLQHLKKDGRQAGEFLSTHNAVRTRYGMPPLKWDSKLARFARRHANKLSTDCKMAHSSGSVYGENIFWALREHRGPKDAVQYWANETVYYDSKTNQCVQNQTCGHFTNIVWKTTEQVGCARVRCHLERGFIAVCSYYPAGNIGGYHPFGYSISPPKSTTPSPTTSPPTTPTATPTNDPVASIRTTTPTSTPKTAPTTMTATTKKPTTTPTGTPTRISGS